MDGISVSLIICVSSAGVCGLMLAFAIVTAVQDEARASWIQKRAGTGIWIDRVLSNGAAPFHGFAQWLLEARLASAIFDRLSLALRIAGRESNPRALCSLLIPAALCFVVIGALSGSFLAGAAFSACLVVVLSSWSNHVIERNRECVREDLPDAVRAMSSCFHAGFSLQQTFKQLSEELQGPISMVFARARDALETGSSAREALDLIHKSDYVSELSFIAVALEVQHRTGGSLKHALDAACESLESELELRRSLRVHTAQARLSARVVTGVTIALIGVLSLLTDDFLDPFFSNAVGFSMLVVAVGMQAVGMIIVRKILHVEVD